MCRFWLLGARMFGRYSKLRRVGNLGVLIFSSAFVLSSITGNHRMNDELGSFFEMDLSVFRHVPIDGTLVLEPRDFRWRLSLHLTDQTHPFPLLSRHIRRHGRDLRWFTICVLNPLHHPVGGASGLPDWLPEDGKVAEIDLLHKQKVHFALFEFFAHDSPLAVRFPVDVALTEVAERKLEPHLLEHLQRILGVLLVYPHDLECHGKVGPSIAAHGFDFAFEDYGSIGS